MNKINWRLIILLLLFVLPAARYLILPGFYEPHDIHHFADIYQMYRAIDSGQIPPRLGPDFLYTFGYPLFNYYYLSPFYLGAFFHFLGFAITTSFKLVFITSLLLSFSGMYLFLREHFTKAASMFGSVVYLYAPYHAVQTYVRGAMGEAMAYGLVPFVFYFTARLIRSKNPNKTVGLAAIVLGLFVITHNYYWILTLPFLLFYVLMVYFPLKKAQYIKLLTTLILGIVISSFWIGPALLEKKYITAETPFPLVDHFPFIKQLLLPSWGYGSSVWGPGDEISFQIGLVNLAVFAGTVGILIKVWSNLKGTVNKRIDSIIKLFTKDQNSRMLVYCIGLFALTFIFMNSRTYPVWQLLPFHDLIQFPWRLLAFIAFLASVMAALVFEKYIPRYSKVIKYFMFFLPIIFTWNYFKPSRVVNNSDSYYLNRMFACSGDCSQSTQVSQEHLNYSEDYLLLPYWVFKKPDFVPTNRFESEIAVITNQVQQSLTSYSAHVIVPIHSRVVANVMYYPGWKVKADNKQVGIRYTAGYGAIEFDLPPGEYDINLVWTETKSRKIFDLVSILGLLTAAFLITSKRQIFVK